MAAGDRGQHHALRGLPRERARLRDLSAVEPATCWDRLLFCAKETVYKAWFPVARCWLGLDDVEVTINAVDGIFETRLLVPPPAVGDLPLAGFAGRWLVRDGLIVTAVTVSRPGQAGAKSSIGWTNIMLVDKFEVFLVTGRKEVSSWR